MSHRSELDKDAVRNVVTAAGVGEQLVEKIAMFIAVPEMMVRIDDLERRFQNFFFALRPPGGIAVARSGGGKFPEMAATGAALLWACAGDR